MDRGRRRRKEDGDEGRCEDEGKEKEGEWEKDFD